MSAEVMDSRHAIDATITRTMRGVLAYTGMPAEVLWRGIGISRTTYYNKLHGTPWTASEVAAAADVLGVEVGDLYSGRIPPTLAAWVPVTDQCPESPVIDLALFRAARAA